MDINKANIANALHSVAKEHIVATADEIYDNDREQYQSEVNEGAGRYIENPEFVCVYTDAEDRIMWGIKANADIFYGAGVPTQLREYVEKKIEELSLDEYEDIVAFLDGFIGSDTTLQAILESLNITIEKKVDKEEGKSLIDEEYASGIRYIENPKFVEVKLDSEERILEAIMKDGTKLLPAGIKTPSIDLDGAVVTHIDNPEFIAVWLTSDDRILFGLQRDGNFLFGCGIPRQIEDFVNSKMTEVGDIEAFLAGFETYATLKDYLDETYGKYIDSPEFVKVETDAEGKVINAITKDGEGIVGGVNVNQLKRDVDAIDPETIKEEVEQVIEEATQGIGELKDVFSVIEDPEGRSEITTDSEGKIISYRDSEGVKHEEVGIETSELTLSKNGVEKIKAQLDEVPVDKNRYLPKFGKVNIKEETFYLTADSRWSTKADVVCIQMLDDTDANAEQRLTLSYYYIKSTLTPLAGGGYDRTSVNENSVRLDLFAGKEIGQTFGVGSDNKTYFTDEVTKVSGVYYATNSLVDGQVVPESIVVTESQTKTYYVKKLKQVDGVWYLNSTLEGGAAQQVDYKSETVNGKAMISVLPVTDVPPYKAWCVNKKPEHYCIADIDFGTFYAKNNCPVSIKYQGSGSTALRKRGFRITFYKKNNYAKKDKVKIGEMVRLSGYNMKAYATDDTRIRDSVLSYFFIEMWETRGKDCYPWNKDSVPFNGATGFIKSFPIETWIGEECYGLQLFGLKKDERNYMLDGDDDNSGIFISGNSNDSDCWINGSHLLWDDEMMDEMSEDTANAIDRMLDVIKGFINGVIEVDGQQQEFKLEMLEEYIDVESWIDYWIGLQLFYLWDSSQHNMILSTRADKKKFYAFFYDLDHSLQVYYDYNEDIMDILDGGNPAQLHIDISFWSKFVDTYKDSIINRYAELRKSVLTIKNIRSIYKSYIQNIPESIIKEEQLRWDTAASPYRFEELIDFFERRLMYLDRNYFCLK